MQGGAVALNHFTGKLVAWDTAEIVIAALQLKVCVAIPATSIRISAKPGDQAGTAVSRTKTCPESKFTTITPLDSCEMERNDGNYQRFLLPPKSR